MIDGMTRDEFGYSEHRATEVMFFKVIYPEIRPGPARALGYAMGCDLLDEPGAEPLLAKLWAGEEVPLARHDRQENEPPLAG